jgi:hypothetical protein
MYRWMRLLGFKYEVRKRCYYVDWHEKPETKVYRKKFAKRYFEDEKLMHRWIQIELTRLWIYFIYCEYNERSQEWSGG